MLLEELKARLAVLSAKPQLTPGDLAELHRIRDRFNSLDTSKAFYHSGDLGDIIYSLPTVKAMGGGSVYLGPDNKSGMKTRELLTENRVKLIAPLLTTQSYVKAVQYAESVPDNVTINLNKFRVNLLRTRCDVRPGMNLVRAHLLTFGLPLGLDRDPWLTVPTAIQHGYPVVVARSSRYHNSRFDWKQVVRRYRNQMVFVGLPDEYFAFCAQFGKVDYRPTGDLLELARVIAGCKVFIGNQSCPLAIAVGLGKPVILEECYWTSNCVFDRPNFTRGFNIKSMPATFAPPLLAKTLTIVGPAENYTGFGQATNALCLGLNNQGIEFRLNAFAIAESINGVSVPLVAPLKSRLNEPPFSPSGDLLICAATEIHDRLQSGQVLLTMWEATRIRPEAVKAINERATCVIVPTQWNAACFSAAGVNVPIRVVGLGIDPTVFSYHDPPTTPIFRFGTAGRLAHAGIRKGVEETIECFLKAFPNEPNVELHIKIFEDCPLKVASKDKRILLHRTFMATPELVGWYASLGCFVSLTKGEGWGLHLHQAMAIGRPLIAPRHGGQAEFMTEQNSYCCTFKLEPPSWSVYQGSGHWCIPDQAHCIDLMRLVYGSQQDAYARGRLASSDVSSLTWGKMVDGVVGVLKEFGKL